MIAGTPLAADLEHLHPALGPDRERGALLGVAVAAARPAADDEVAQLLVGGAVAHRAPEVEATGGEQAGDQLALRGEPGPGAVAAERLADRGDDPDLARAVDVAVPLGHLAPVVGLHRLE